MPILDLSDAVNDVMLQDVFSVLRRPASVNSSGIASVVSAAQFTNVTGVVFPMKGGLRREESTTLHDKGIVVITSFLLRGTSVDSSGQGFQPDVIIWGGNNFLVDDIKDWSRFGPGFVRAECTLLDLQSAPPKSDGVIMLSLQGLRLYTPVVISATQFKLLFASNPEGMLVLRNGLPQFSPGDYTSAVDTDGNTVLTFAIPLNLNGPNPDTVAVYV